MYIFAINYNLQSIFEKAHKAYNFQIMINRLLSTVHNNNNDALSFDCESSTRINNPKFLNKERSIDGR